MMSYIVYCICISVIAWYFWYLRSLAEYARKYIQQYCQNNGLQFMSVARGNTSLAFDKRFGAVWKTQWDFEFSGDGESAYSGRLKMFGRRIEHIDTPAYRV